MDKKRIVVKIGSSSLTNSLGDIDEEKFLDHVQAAAALRKAGHEVLLVSSGAVAAGFRKLGYSSRPVTLKGRQAAAAVGQSLLIQAYTEHFKDFSIIPAQVLLTRNDFSRQDRYKNAYAAITELLERRILPIVNENDTVSVEELTFGDNDMLSALLSGLVHADQLIILTDINGVYDANPSKCPDAKRFDRLQEISGEIMKMASGTGSKAGTGGMKSKLAAASTALSLGVKVFIGAGKGPEKLLDIVEGRGDGTYVDKDAMAAVPNRKQWIFYHSHTAGRIFIDEGAEKALTRRGSSLLPAGVYRIEGAFKKGDVVEVYGASGILGKGAVSCSAEELAASMGKRSDEACFPACEVIHRDRWAGNAGRKKDE